MHTGEMASEFRTFERDVEEEPQRGDGGVDARSADLLLGQMQLIEAAVLSRGGVRRAGEKAEASHLRTGARNQHRPVLTAAFKSS
ncbi:hypothetical protein [Rhodoblastus acidophilus]|uniref:hypothetical protein n=1 Tax=Rhodoblastus acidophilus TaxID=1074 RepID=UPI003CC871EE